MAWLCVLLLYYCSEEQSLILNENPTYFGDKRLHVLRSLQRYTFRGVRSWKINLAAFCEKRLVQKNTSLRDQLGCSVQARGENVLKYWISSFRLLYNKKTIDWVVYKQQKIISCSSGDWEVWDQSAGRSGLWWGPASLLTDDHVLKPEGERELSGVPFRTTLIPFLRALLSWPNHLSIAPPHLGLGIWRINFEGIQTFSLLQLLLRYWSRKRKRKCERWQPCM